MKQDYQGKSVAPVLIVRFESKLNYFGINLYRIALFISTSIVNQELTNIFHNVNLKSHHYFLGFQCVMKHSVSIGRGGIGKQLKYESVFQ